MIRDEVKSLGTLTLELRDKDDKLLTKHTRNLVVNVGLAHITSRLLDDTSAIISHMAIGGGTSAATGANTALITERSRVALQSMTRVTTNATNDTVRHVAVFPAGSGTGTITEAGLFNAASAGSMFARTVFGVITKNIEDTLTITWDVRFAG